MNLYEVKAKIQQGEPVMFRARAGSSNIDLVIGNMKTRKAEKAEKFDFSYLDERMFFYQINPVADIWFEEEATH